MLTKTIFVLYFTLLSFEVCVCDENLVEVNTTSGLVRGQTIRVLNTSVDQFLSIPFAEPPVGNLRFARPLPLKKPISGTIDGTKMGNSCMQPPGPIPGVPITLSEDCLILNIWTPNVRDNSPSSQAPALKPVMFWIYGGGLATGSIFLYNGSLLSTHDVVIVAPNYRLGPFGFLYGGNDSAPGNLGFYDQLLALKWVRDNIHLFGGDKDQITVFGESAGSWSTSVQILSPLSRGLFKRAIMESGANFHYKERSVLTATEALDQTKEMAKHFNCSEDQWLQCLRQLSAEDVNNYTSITTWPLEGTEYLPIDAQTSFREGKYNKDIDIIAGVTRDEGSLLSYWIYPELHGNFTEQEFRGLVQGSDFFFHGIPVQNVTDYYLRNVNTSDSQALKHAFYNYFGDIFMKCPTYLFAKQFAINAKNTSHNVYYYELTYQAQDGAIYGCVEETMGICHGSDVAFVFGQLFEYNSTTPLDLKFSAEIMQMWTQFAKNGLPSTEWPTLIDHNQMVRVKNLNPHTDSPVMVNPFESTCDGVWRSYFV